MARPKTARADDAEENRDRKRDERASPIFRKRAVSGSASVQGGIKRSAGNAGQRTGCDPAMPRKGKARRGGGGRFFPLRPGVARGRAGGGCPRETAAGSGPAQRRPKGVPTCQAQLELAS